MKNIKSLGCSCARCNTHGKNAKKICNDILKQYKKEGDLEKLKISIYKSLMEALDCCP